ncbi:hypothetical protein [Occultella gossypii]|uniref:Uncharacterized protein n=1 Tax=Occultella gossypii TaxID=2800820 RepID=A0ABS7S963_9MICO|nr:hypothetical protein [Occultella gossypii]MBZ2196877.1 hypothetical protein [Occultella gossypii]
MAHLAPQPGSSADLSRPSALQALIAAMAVGLDPYDVQGLTLAQKELLADIVDAEHAAADRADGIEPGHPLAYEPEWRWWRESVLPPAQTTTRVS